MTFCVTALLQLWCDRLWMVKKKWFVILWWFLQHLFHIGSFCNGSYNTYLTLGWISCLWGSHQCEEVFCKYVHNFWNFSRNFWLFEFIFGFHACEVCINGFFFFFFIHHSTLNFFHSSLFTQFLSLHLLGNHHFDHGFVSKKKKKLKKSKVAAGFSKAICIYKNVIVTLFL